MSGYIQIIGAGALGKMLAHLLTQAGFSARLYGRRGLFREPTTIVEAGREYPLLWKEEASGEALLTLITTKAYDLLGALEGGGYSQNVPLVLLCNGYIEPLIKTFRSSHPHLTIRKGLVTRGAKPDGDDRLVLSAKGEVSWGAESGDLTPIEQEIFAKVSSIKYDQAVCRSRKIKWYCNTVLNTLAGAYRLPSNGAALSHPDYPILNAEVFALMSELWPGEFQDASAMRSLLDELIKMTEANENSMAVDVRLGRRTEIEVLSAIAFTQKDHARKFPRLTELHKKLQNQKK